MLVTAAFGPLCAGGARQANVLRPSPRPPQNRLCQVHEPRVREVLCMGAGLNRGQDPLLVEQCICLGLGEMTVVQDPYRAYKTRFNRLAMAALLKIAVIVKRSLEPLLATARFAIAANAIDIGVATELTDADVREALLGSTDAHFHGDGRVRPAPLELLSSPGRLERQGIE